MAEKSLSKKGLHQTFSLACSRVGLDRALHQRRRSGTNFWRDKRGVDINMMDTAAAIGKVRIQAAKRRTITTQ